MQLLSARSMGFFGFVCGVVATPGCKTNDPPIGFGASGGGAATAASGGAVAAGGGIAVGGNSASSSGGAMAASSGGNTNATAGGMASTSGGSSAAGGNTPTTAGGAATQGGAATTGGSNQGGSNTGGATAKGGATVSGGSSSGGSSSGGSSSGGASAAGGAAAGNTGTVGPGTYALPAPNACTNKFSIQNCKKGDTTSVCKGVCSSDYGSGAQSACEGGKTGVPVNFACPRFLLYSDEFIQAAIDDGFGGVFNYGIVGHDVDTNGVDGTKTEACCQCYQFVFDYPNENQCWVDPNNSSNPQSALPPPKPMIAQSFNTAAGGPRNFDIYMGAGGLGANNGCFSIGGSSSPAGLYQYTGYPAAGQPGDGGVKPAGNWGNGGTCKTTNTNWVTEATLSTSECVAKVSAACNEIKATDARQQAAAIRSCIKSNDPKSDYHLNWYIWVKRVECPTHLTEVTGCKLAPQGLPAADPNVTTVAQAKAAGFRQKTPNNDQYTNTTMEDCCMPTCAWSDNVKSATVNGYASFYSCNQAGIPLTQ